VEAVQDPITICVTASPKFAAHVAAGNVPDVLVPAGMIPASSPLGALVADLDRYREPSMPGGKRICPRLEQARVDDTVLIGMTTTPADAPELADTWRSLVRSFPTAQRCVGGDPHLVSLVLVVPFADPVAGSALVDEAHALVKPFAISHGTLPGEFGRELSGAGTRFPHVETRRSIAAEYIVVRALLVGADAKYINTPEAVAAYAALLKLADAG